MLKSDVVGWRRACPATALLAGARTTKWKAWQPALAREVLQPTLRMPRTKHNNSVIVPPNNEKSQIGAVKDAA